MMTAHKKSSIFSPEKSPPQEPELDIAKRTYDKRIKMSKVSLKRHTSFR